MSAAACKCTRINGVAVAPRRARANPARPARVCSTRHATGKLTMAERAKLPACAFADTKNRIYPIHDPGHASAAIAYIEKDFQHGRISAVDRDAFRKRARAAQRRFGVEVSSPNPGPGPAKTKETTPMAAKKKGKGKKRGRKAARSPAQIAAQKKAAKASKKARAGKKKAAAVPKKRGRRAAKKTAARKTAPRKGAARKGVRETTARRPSAQVAVSVRNVHGTGEAPARKTGTTKRGRRAAKKTAARKTAPRKTAPRKVGRRTAARRPLHGSSVIPLRHNPMVTTKRMIAFGAFTALGIGGFTLLDRLIASRPQKDNPNANPFYGTDAFNTRNARPDGVRIGAAAGGTTVIFGVTYLLRHQPWAPAVLGGLFFGGLLETVSLGVRWLLPKVISPLTEGELTWLNRLLPETYTNSDGTSRYIMPANAPHSVGALPPWRQGRQGQRSTVAAADFGPVASGHLAGCGCADCCARSNGDEAEGPKVQCPVAGSRSSASALPGSDAAVQQGNVVRIPVGPLYRQPSKSLVELAQEEKAKHPSLVGR